MARLVLLVMLVCVPAMWVLSQEVGEGKAGKKGKAKREYRGQLPAGWSEIGLNEEQVDKIKAAQVEAHSKAKPIEEELADLRAREGELRQQLADIREALDAELYGMLTTDQLKKLEEVKAKKVREVLQKRGSGS